MSERKQAEETLLQSESLLRAVMDNSNDIIFVKDREGRFLYLNPECCRLNGRTQEQLLGCLKSDLFPGSKEAAQCLTDDLRVMALDQVETIEETLRAADGAWHVFLTTKAPRHDSQGHVIGLVGIGHDITERKEAEEALRQSEERYRLLFSELMNGCALHSIICDEQGNA